MSDMQVQFNNQTTSLPPKENRQERIKKRRSRLAILNFILLWILLIVGGLYGAHTYMKSIETRLSQQLALETEKQLAEMEAKYTTELSKLDTSYNEKISALGNQINELNQLLTFVKDNSNNESDDSNQLYSQINEIKSQLKTLQKNMELLK